jgi:hypothetical protein
MLGGQTIMRSMSIVRKWSQQSILEEILRRYGAQEDLSYSGVTREHLSLLRAATRYFGTWQAAIERAGLSYEEIRRYRIWTNERIVARIRELHAQGADLSWRHVATQLDPGLAAAATKKSHFGSWKTALEQAGLDYAQIRRYLDWSEEEVLRRLRDRHTEGKALNAKSMERENVPLITAARRRFPSWDRALSAAGLDYRGIVLRTPFKRSKPAEAPSSPPDRPAA